MRCPWCGGSGRLVVFRGRQDGLSVFAQTGPETLRQAAETLFPRCGKCQGRGDIPCQPDKNCGPKSVSPEDSSS